MSWMCCFMRSMATVFSAPLGTITSAYFFVGRGRDLEHVLHQYTTLVKPAFEEFCLPTKKYADVIVPRGAENTVAIDLIKQHIQDIIWRSNGNKESTLNR